MSTFFNYLIFFFKILNAAYQVEVNFSGSSSLLKLFIQRMKEVNQRFSLKNFFLIDVEVLNFFN